MRQGPGGESTPALNGWEGGGERARRCPGSGCARSPPRNGGIPCRPVGPGQLRPGDWGVSSASEGHRLWHTSRDDTTITAVSRPGMRWTGGMRSAYQRIGCRQQYSEETLASVQGRWRSAYSLRARSSIMRRCLSSLRLRRCRWSSAATSCARSLPAEEWPPSTWGG